MISKPALLLLLASVAIAPQAATAAFAGDCDCASSNAADTPSAADKAFEKLSNDEYEWRKTQLPIGEDSPNGNQFLLPDVSRAAQAKRLQYWEDTADTLTHLDTERLSPANLVNLEVYKAQIDTLIAAQKFRDYEKPLNSDSSFWGDLVGYARESIRTEEEAERYIAMLNGIPAHFADQIANMRIGLERGFTPPKITLVGRDSAVRSVVEAKSPTDVAYYAPFKELPSSIPADRAKALQAEAEAAIRDKVLPAYRTLLAFLNDEYFPGARDGLAAYGLPDGKAYYRSKIREFVTLDLTPEAIHQTGLDEIARLRQRMDAVMKEVKFEGDLPAFLTFLRTDPQFYAKTPQELLNRAAWIAKTFDAKADDYFGRMPRRRFAIKPVPDDIAPFYTGGRGGPGIYLVNTYNLPARPLYSLVALTLHESAPGHAMQMPLAGENTTLPAFRRDTYISAYGEGWALYSEALGEEMGMYETPWDIFGMLSYQAWRASRLVVDTGVHAFGWSREQAQQYLRDNTALAEHEIVTEVDRYIAWPGQALSYYLGELHIIAARKRAEEALGPKFDLRAFHDAVLELGSVPLPVIDQRIDRLIREGGKGPYSEAVAP
ncbi:DUF885 domain-containing protein [Gimibacter soli]|uniref:DUF885 family protein n=1 Tax=Gimibacter soli TaxID=3024400 RepID=A0AAE9XMD4_9PROT|nr:DUF885 family protein [Gimibacter soli]WCL53573.1 DUF885 family protein [Gimibacter soli]